MLILDWILIFIAIIIISIQTLRSAKDVDLVLFEMLALIVATNLSIRLHLKLASSTGLNESIALLFLFIIMTIILFIIAGFVVKYAQFSLAPVDTWLGFIMGFISAWSVLTIILIILSKAYPDGLTLNLGFYQKPIVIYDSLENSLLAKQILNFYAIKAVESFLNRINISQ